MWKRDFWFENKVKWKRRNYDLHKNLGFYSLGFALIFCITGLVFAFPGFKKNYIKFFDGISFHTSIHKPASYAKVAQIYNQTLDSALVYALQKHPNAAMMSIRLKEKDTKQAIQVRLEKGKTNIFYTYEFDKKTGQINNVEAYNTQTLGKRMASLNYDLHVGSIGGIYTKLVALMVVLICASLPITGFIHWMNKGKKKKKNK